MAESRDDDVCMRCGRTQWEHDSCDVMACGSFVPHPEDEREAGDV